MIRKKDGTTIFSITEEKELREIYNLGGRFLTVKKEFVMVRDADDKIICFMSGGTALALLDYCMQQGKMDRVIITEIISFD